MGLPNTTEDIVISSPTYTLRGGNTYAFQLRFIDNNDVFSDTYNMTVSDVGSYEIDFDVQEDTDDINVFYINVPSLEFKFWSRLSTGQDFGAMLAQLTFTDLIEVKFTINGNDDYYICQKSDFSYDRDNREVSVRAFSPLKYGGDYAANLINTFSTTSYELDETFYDRDEFGDPVYDYTIITFLGLLDAFLNTTSTSATTRIKSDLTVNISDITAISAGSTIDTDIYVTNTNGNISAIEGANHEYYINDADQDEGYNRARERVLEAALIEAAIVGNAFGEAFYVRRDYNSTSDANFYANIDESQLEVLDIQFYTSPLRSITVDYDNTVEVVEVFGNAPQRIEVTLPSFASTVSIEKLSSPPTPSQVYEIFDQGAGEISDATLASTCATSYKNAIGADDAIRWSGTIFGVDTIKPYQFAVLDTSINNILDDNYITTDNQKIRFSSLKYNFKEDKIDFEAYSI